MLKTPSLRKPSLKFYILVEGKLWFVVLFELEIDTHDSAEEDVHRSNQFMMGSKLGIGTSSTRGSF